MIVAIFTKFGVEIRDQVTFTVAKRRWQQTVMRYDNEIQGIRPLEGDLVFTPFSKKIFQIMHVEHEQPFYQLNNLPVFKLRVQLAEYSDEDLDTGITEIDEKLEDVSLDLLLNQITLESGTTSAGSLMAEQSDGNIEALLSEAGAYLVDETDGDNIILEDDPNYVDYIIQEDALTGNLATDSSGASNISFDDEAGLNDTNSSNDIFDFSEKNPFGDPSDI